MDNEILLEVTCVIVQQTGNGAICALSCKFDSAHDRVVQVVYAGEKDCETNHEMSCIITAVGVVV